MSHEIYFKAVAACLLGNILHIVAKILILWKDHKNANIEFSLKKYFKDDYVPIGADAVFSFSVVYLVDEFTVYVPWALSYVKAFFLLLGFGGSYIILNLLSRSEKKLRAVIDVKTNIADAIVPPKVTEQVADSGHSFTEGHELPKPK
jgi:hypothetical protein